MRVNPNLYANIGSSIESSEQSLQNAVNQLASGKRVSLPSDDPIAFAANLRSLAASANVDRYTKNASAVVSQAQMADAALSTVISTLTQAVSLGTEGANGSLTSSQRGAITQQVQGLLDTVVSQANVSYGGVHIFAGTAMDTTPFVADPRSPNGYSYQGTSNSNQTEVGDGLSIAIQIPGDQIFTSSDGNVLGSLRQLISVLPSGSSSDVATAVAAVSAAIAQVGNVRVAYGSTVTALNNQESYLRQETLSLTAQQNSLTDIDLATAATNLTQAQTAHSAILAMAAKLLPVSLLDYLK